MYETCILIFIIEDSCWGTVSLRYGNVIYSVNYCLIGSVAFLLKFGNSYFQPKQI